MSLSELLALLRRFYWIVLAPALIALGLSGFLVADIPGTGSSRAVSVAFLVISGGLAVVLPLWQRIFFGRNTTRGSSVGRDSFVSFQKRFMLSGLLSVYVVPLAFLCNIDKIPLLWIIILALYAAYYYYPSQRRVEMDSRIFRVQEFR